MNEMYLNEPEKASNCAIITAFFGRIKGFKLKHFETGNFSRKSVHFYGTYPSIMKTLYRRCHHIKPKLYVQIQHQCVVKDLWAESTKQVHVIHTVARGEEKPYVTNQIIRIWKPEIVVETSPNWHLNLTVPINLCLRAKIKFVTKSMPGIIFNSCHDELVLTFAYESCTYSF